MMNKVVFVQIVTSKLNKYEFLLKLLFSTVVNFYIEMPMIQKNVIIYVIIKQVYVHMNVILKDIALKMVHIVHMLMVQMIYVNQYLIVEKYKTVI
jgi:hypothetical protein